MSACRPILPAGRARARVGVSRRGSCGAGSSARRSARARPGSRTRSRPRAAGDRLSSARPGSGLGCAVSRFRSAVRLANLGPARDRFDGSELHDANAIERRIFVGPNSTSDSIGVGLDLTGGGGRLVASAGPRMRSGGSITNVASTTSTIARGSGSSSTAIATKSPLCGS